MKQKILFLYHSDINWYNIYPLYKMFNDAGLYQCDIITVPIYYEDITGGDQFVENDEIDENVTQSESVDSETARKIADQSSKKFQTVRTELLENENLTYLDGSTYEFIMNDEYDLVVYGYPYEHLLPKKFHLECMRKVAKKIAYLPYGIDVSAGASVDLIAYNLPIHFGADAIFFQSESARRRFLKKHPNAQDRVFALSTPRFDSLFYLDQRELNNPNLKEKIANRYTVLWNSHFSFANNTWSTLDRVFEPFFDFFTNNKNDMALIWRPHPNTVSYLVDSGLMTMGECIEFFDEVQAAGIILDLSNNHLDAFQLSDCMLTDASSLCIEYIGTGKPMVLLNNPDGMHYFDDYFNELIKFYDKTDSAQDAISLVEKFFAGQDNKKQLRKFTKNNFVYKFDGNATERVYHKLLEIIS